MLFFVCVQHPSHSDSSLAAGSSEGSLQTPLEEGLSFGDSSPRNLDLPLPHHRPNPRHRLRPQRPATSCLGQSLQKRHGTKTTTVTLQATQRHERSQSSSRAGSTSPDCPPQDSIDSSNQIVGMGTGGHRCRQTLNSEHLSENLNSLSLTSLFTSRSLVPTLVKKCKSTGSLSQSNLFAQSEDGRHLSGMNAHVFLSSHWTEGTARGAEEDIAASFKVKGNSQPTDSSSRKKRWNPFCLSALELVDNLHCWTFNNTGKAFLAHFLWENSQILSSLSMICSLSLFSSYLSAGDK